MPTNVRCRVRSRRFNLGELTDWERAFVNGELITEDMHQRGSFLPHCLIHRPYNSNPETIRSRILGVWQLRN